MPLTPDDLQQIASIIAAAEERIETRSQETARTIYAHIEQVSAHIEQVSAAHIEQVSAHIEHLSAHIERVSARIEHVSAHIGHLSAHIERVSAHVEHVETSLLTEFHKWASPLEARVRTHAAAIRAIDVEQEFQADRLSKLEGKKPEA